VSLLNYWKHTRGVHYSLPDAPGARYIIGEESEQLERSWSWATRWGKDAGWYLSEEPTTTTTPERLSAIVKPCWTAEVEAPISLDGLAVHPDCWCVCLCYLHFAPENPEDGKMCLLVPAHPGCPRQGPESCKVVVLCVPIMWMWYLHCLQTSLNLGLAVTLTYVNRFS